MFPSRVNGRNVVIFSRRVNDADGGFAGLVVVSVEAEYLAPLLDGRTLRAGDFLVVRDDAGLVQGYLVSRPVPADEAALLMDRRYLFPRMAMA